MTLQKLCVVPKDPFFSPLYFQVCLECLKSVDYFPDMPVNARNKRGTNRDKQGQAGTRQGQAGIRLGRAGTWQGQTGTNKVNQTQSQSIPVCPCMSMSVPVCSCLKCPTMPVPVFPSLSPLITACPFLVPGFVKYNC